MATSLARPLEIAAEKAGPEFAAKAGEYLGSMEKFFETEHPNPKVAEANQVLKEKANEFLRTKQTNMATTNEHFKTTRETIADFPDLKDKHGPGKATTLQEIHTDLQNHPDPRARAAAQNTGAMLAQHPLNAQRSLLELSDRAPFMARKAAQDQVFLPNNKALTPEFYKILQEVKNDPTAQTNADNLANVFSRITEDRVEDMRYGKPDPVTGIPTKRMGAVSQTKKDIEAWIDATNKFKREGEGAAQLKNVDPVYKAPGKFERDLTKFTYRTVTSWIVLPHVGQYFNLGADVWRNLGKAVSSLTDKDFRESLTDYGVTAATQHSILNEAIHWEQGKTARVIGPGAARIIGKFLYNPFFHSMRMGQLMFGGAVGYHALEKMGEDALAGDAGAMENLRRLHIDPRGVITNGGKLEEADMARGVYHFTNDRLFIDKVLSRSVRSSSNIYLRNMSMFHTFVTYQASFMQKELARLWKTRDFVGLASFGATMAILFPQVAPMIKSAELYTRTWDLDKAKQSIKEDYGKMWGPDSSAWDRFSKWFEMMTYIGSMGVFHSFWNAAAGHRLAQSFSFGGPMVQAGAEELQDVHDFIKGTQSGEHHYQRAVRQALRYTVPVVGGPIGQKFFPTPQD